MGHYAAEMLYPEYKPTEDELEKQRQARAERDARWQKQMNQWAREWTTATPDNHNVKNGKKTKKNKK